MQSTRRPGSRSTTPMPARRGWPRPPMATGTAWSCAGQSSPIPSRRSSDLPLPRLCHRPCGRRRLLGRRSPASCCHRARHQRPEGGIGTFPLPFWALWCQWCLGGVRDDRPQPDQMARCARARDPRSARRKDDPATILEPSGSHHAPSSTPPAPSADELAVGRAVGRLFRATLHVADLSQPLAEIACGVPGVLQHESHR